MVSSYLFYLLQFILFPHDLILHCIFNYNMSLTFLNRMNWDELSFTCQILGIPLF
ncbi:putative signal peptide protein [Puccinia sorghi]|uniref:Putative signal peptide protein n=1 Tax=Puccinia sorghi TaxID=27349 RepID=A0A0L6V8F8_9BASI|nr:putative signal peptide protein [Puccinia sorghi]